MIPNIVDQFVDVTDPARLHAELWGDFVSKVITCWLPILMSTVLVGRDLLGSSIQCFPLDLVHVPAKPENGTFIPDGNSSNNAFSGVSVYTRQLSEFVNTYCAGKNSFPEDTIFSYQFFAMMLVVQAGIMYLPFLIWNLTKGREIISIVRFISYDMEVVYDRFRKQSTQDQSRGQGTGDQGSVQTQAQEQNVNGRQGVETQGNRKSQASEQKMSPYEQEELVEAEKQWRADCTMYTWYVVKQAVSIVISVGFLMGFVCQLKSIFNIRDKFPCSVEEKFNVTCTVPAAKVHQCIWVTDMVLLGINMFVILINIVVLYKRAEDYPFAEIGPGAPEKKLKEKEKSKELEKKSKETKSHGAEGRSIEQVGIEVGGSDEAEAQPLTNGESDKDQKEATKQGLAQSCMECFPHFNDSCLMHAFFKANVESVEKYNYVKNLLKVAPKLNNSQRPQS